jgi:hypothetical protein
MPKILVHNGTDKVVKLGIEPWADLVELAPNDHADFEYDERLRRAPGRRTFITA